MTTPYLIADVPMKISAKAHFQCESPNKTTYPALNSFLRTI